jgi:tetratricopeptide (TPR) repeat protein
VFKNGSREIRKGYKESQSGNWENAEILWRKALMNPKNINQARATFNIGLANEMNGSLEPAIEWVQKSVEIFPDTINKIYLQILENRLLQQDDLFYQMEGLNTDKP